MAASLKATAVVPVSSPGEAKPRVRSEEPLRMKLSCRPSPVSSRKIPVYPASTITSQTTTSNSNAVGANQAINLSTCV